jgi:hypothetical protein
MPTRALTGKPHRLTAVIDIDGSTYRVMGREPVAAAPMPQTSLTVNSYANGLHVPRRESN